MAEGQLSDFDSVAPGVNPDSKHNSAVVSSAVRPFICPETKQIGGCPVTFLSTHHWSVLPASFCVIGLPRRMD